MARMSSCFYVVMSLHNEKKKSLPHTCTESEKMSSLQWIDHLEDSIFGDGKQRQVSSHGSTEFAEWEGMGGKPWKAIKVKSKRVVTGGAMVWVNVKDIKNK